MAFRPTFDPNDPLLQEQLRAHPTLKPFDGKTSAHALAAKNVRVVLKKAYPHVTFSITSESYSMGSSLTVGWDLMPGAPTREEIEDRIKAFSYGAPDAPASMDDSFTYDRDPQRRAFRDVFGSVKYAHAQGRVLTPEEIVAIETKALERAMQDTPKAKPAPSKARARL